MTYQQPLFATLAVSLCMLLGVFALYENRHSKSNCLFAAYNFCNALWNSGEMLFWSDEIGKYAWVLRITGVGGCLFIPFALHFTYEMLGIADRKIESRVTKTFYVLAVVFAVLHQTPLLHTTVIYNSSQRNTEFDVAGPLFPLYAIFILAGMSMMLTPLPKLLKTATGLLRHRIYCVFWVAVVGSIALFFFFASLIQSVNYSWLYLPLQIIVGFIFSYSIYKHDVVHFSVALRRVVLLIGIYTLIFVTLSPVVMSYHATFLSNGPSSLVSIMVLLVLVSAIVSIAPIAYAWTIRHSALFQDKMTSHITHEFKSPLHAIQGAKAILDEELAKPSPNPEKIHDYLDMIQRNSNRLEKFVLEILSVGKAGEEIKSENRAEIDLKKVAEDCIKTIPGLRARAEIKSDSSAAVQGSSEGLTQIFTNLLSNASTFCPEGKIVITIKKLTNSVEVCVSDQGTGIHKQDLDRIFSPFFSKEGKTQKKGTGLGLSIAQKWVQAHKGRIWAESDGPGKGARFWFTLPQ